MSLHFLSAKPRNGKSRYAVDFVFEELIYGNRHIITNLPLKLDRINELMQERYPKVFERRYVLRRAWESYVVGDASVNIALDRPRHITEDIELIEDADLSTFFTHRGNGVRLDHIGNDAWRAGKRPDYSKVNDLGVLYILDEVHIPFNSRALATTGAEVLYYLSQHAKLSDTVIAITQNVGNVDKQFRSLAQDFTYITYLKKRRFGKFRLPDKFVWRTYPEMCTSDRQTPMDSGFFDLDRDDYANCYDTAKGVGIHGRAGADMNERKKGLSWTWLVSGFLLTAFLMFKVLPGFLAHRFVPGVSGRPSVEAAVPESTPASGGAPAPGPQSRDVTLFHNPVTDSISPGVNVPAVSESRDLGQRGDEPDTDYSVYCTGWVKRGQNAITVFLSDGTVADSMVGEVGIVTRQFVVVNGTRYPVRKLKNSDTLGIGTLIKEFHKDPGVAASISRFQRSLMRLDVLTKLGVIDRD